ncbi:glycosyltransferase family 1 protein [uncultured Clostridium sp.]|uniref:glycosyltransferase family 1 protein n=1 Tax=uncultured Clostridium sp. TaxID=59620 RepID=UPI0025E67289|nr:glycosyltransferase family 1 protein [uncultured Clostridium sp.]
MEPIRILYVNGGPMNRGGIESYMMNYYRNFDKSKIQIDFVAIGERATYDDEIESLGGKMYYIPKKSKNYLGYKKGLRNIFKSGKYKVVHTHMDAMGMTVLKEAKKFNIPIRIAHSHNTQHLTNNHIKLKINEYARKNINKYATHMFACSELAGRWLFGDEAFESGKVEVIKNAINIEKFKFDMQKRNILRNKYDILNDEIVIGHVGRFDYQKNHKFTIEMFQMLINKNKKYKLFLIGNGQLKDEIKKLIKSYGIEENVIILDACDNVNDFYNIFDIFILPSKFEGLGIVAIEAQVNGIPCILSDNIPMEAKVSENVKFISLDNKRLWIKEIKYVTENILDRRHNIDNIIKKGYDIKIQSKKLQNKYILLYKEILN